jgi:hypothetical protein
VTRPGTLALRNNRSDRNEKGSAMQVAEPFRVCTSAPRLPEGFKTVVDNDR